MEREDPNYVPEHDEQQQQARDVSVPKKGMQNQELLRAKLIEKIRPARFMYDQADKDYKRKEKKEAWWEATAKELGISKLTQTVD